MILSDRLRFIYEKLLPQQAVWDFCCDHGYLGSEALRSGGFPEVHFVDQVPHIIENLQRKIQSELPELAKRAFFKAGKGENLSQAVEGTVVIAGVGAHTIFKIVEGLWRKNQLHAKRLILAPQRDEKKLLQMLESLGESFRRTYVLSEEQSVDERNRSRFIYTFEFSL